MIYTCYPLKLLISSNTRATDRRGRATVARHLRRGVRALSSPASSSAVRCSCSDSRGQGLVRSRRLFAWLKQASQETHPQIAYLLKALWTQMFQGHEQHYSFREDALVPLRKHIKYRNSLAYVIGVGRRGWMKIGLLVNKRFHFRLEFQKLRKEELRNMPVFVFPDDVPSWR